MRLAVALVEPDEDSEDLGVPLRRHDRIGLLEAFAVEAALPRIRDYVGRSLRHPALGDLCDFYLRHGVVTP